MTTRVLQPIQTSAGNRPARGQQQDSGKAARMAGPEGLCEAKRPRLDTEQVAPQQVQRMAAMDGASNAGISGRHVAEGPSDFGNFHVQLRSRRGADSSTPVPATTFLDKCKGASAAGASEAAQRQAYHDILRSLGDTRTLSRGPSAGLDNALPGPGPGPSSSGQNEVVAQHMPYDWTLKRSVRFSSAVPLSVCELALRLEPASVAMAQAAFASGVVRNLAVGTLRLPPEARLHAAMLSWRFPETSWDTTSVQMLLAAPVSAAGNASAGSLPGAGTGGPGGTAASISRSSVLGQRLQAWRNALRNAYVQLRSGHCPALYLTSQGPRPVSVLFCAVGVRGVMGQAPHALVSQSTRVMRNRLTAAGIDYVLPLAPVERDERTVQQAAKLRQVDPEDADLEADPDDVEAVLTGGTGASAGAMRYTSVKDHSPESVLLLRGAQAVHGLLDLLLNEVRYQDQHLLGGRETADLPVLLAPVVFEGATLHRPPMRLRPADSTAAGAGMAAGRPPLPRPPNGSTLVARPLTAVDETLDGDSRFGLQSQGGKSNDGAATAGSDGNSYMDLAGPLPPWVVHRTWHVLQECQQGNLQAQLEAEPSCLSLNIDPVALEQSAMKQGQEHQGGGAAPQHWRGMMNGTGDEAEALCSRGAVIHRRVIKSVACQQGSSLLLRLS